MEKIPHKKLFELQNVWITNGFRDNFHGMHQIYTCQLCGDHIDSQENALHCKSVIKQLGAEYKEMIKLYDYMNIFWLASS